MKAIIPAAGQGKRLRPISRVVPKEMFPVGNYPAIEWILDEVFKSGFTDVLIVISHHKTMIADYLTKHSQATSHFNTVEFIFQENPRGLGDIFFLAGGYVDDSPFALFLPDDLYCGDTEPMQQMAKIHGEMGGSILALVEEPIEHIGRYGNFLLSHIAENLYEIKKINSGGDIQNHATFLAGLGRYIMDPVCIQYAKELRKEHREGELSDGKILEEMLNNGEKIYAVLLDGERCDITTSSGYGKAISYLGDTAPIWDYDNHYISRL